MHTRDLENEIRTLNSQFKELEWKFRRSEWDNSFYLSLMFVNIFSLSMLFLSSQILNK